MNQEASEQDQTKKTRKSKTDYKRVSRISSQKKGGDEEYTSRDKKLAEEKRKNIIKNEDLFVGLTLHKRGCLVGVYVECDILRWIIFAKVHCNE
ncbi:unnamed protein product [Sphenostylis stenocarpa]|uniref:Uncharacterized protein n=1 Tax=Sphenostylis stenocarpa TaxID=92480 RepID=A0AA86VY98_9FABA|nr:unnamed protein product [Sphenostylis stenocarpa]